MEVRARCSAGVGRSLDAAHGSATSLTARIAAWVMVVLALVLASPVSATSYVYDANGRLIAVTNDAGESARYFYDVMGNIQKVDRLAADQLALFAFTPGRGVTGMQVRLQGHGFSATPGANTVRFSGISASVLSASSSDLVAIVPVGAVTGPVSVTVGGQSVTSNTDFIVDQNAREPRIDSISPQVVSAGTSVTVAGESLYPLPYQTTVRVGARAGVVGAVANTQLDFAVPNFAASGKVSVSTPYGMAISEQDLIVLPTGVTAAEVESFRRITPDAPAVTLSVQATGKQIAVLIDAGVGEHLDAQFSAISAGNLSYTLYDPSNRRVAGAVATPSDPTALLPPAASTGTYLLLIKPSQAPATWNLSIERSRKIVSGGDSVTVATAIPGQKRRLVFSAAVDQRLGLGIDGLTASNTSGISVNVLNRESSVTSSGCYTSYEGCHLNIRSPQTAVYAVVLSPGTATQTFQAKVTLSADIQGVLQRELPLDLVVPRRGQNARLSFNAQAGESLALQVTTQVTQPAGKSVNYGVYKPDGTLLTSFNALTHHLLNLPSLPQSGQYSVFIDAEQAASLSSRILLTEGVSNGGQVDGAPAEVATQSGGQSVYFNFNVTEADQAIGVGISDLVLSSGTYVNVQVYRPDGASLGSATCYQVSGGCGLNVRAPAVGRYSVVVQPTSSTQTMQLKAWISADLQATMTRETPINLYLARRGQNARLYIDAAAGESLAVQIAGQIANPASASVYYQIHKPDGTLLVSSYATWSETLRLTTLPTAGRYMLFVDPTEGAIIQSRVTLTAGRQTALEIDGASGDYVAPIPGHPAYLTFSTTTAGQRLGLALSNVELTTGSYVSAYVHGPNGAQVASTTCYSSQIACSVNILAPIVGTYSILVVPQSATQLMRFKATLSNDLYMDLAREQPINMVVPRLGQNARLRFNAVAGDNLSLQIAGQTSTGNASVPYSVYKPDGSSLTSMSTTSFNHMTMMNLPVSGDYSIFVDPNNGAAVQARVLLTAGNGGSPELDGAVGAVTTTIGGQATFATFDVDEIDQRLGVGISDLVVSTGSYAWVYVYRPNGGTVVSTTCYQSYGGCELNVRAPEVGTYGIVVIPQSDTQTLDYKVTISNDLRRTLPRETPTMLALPRRGENGRLSFNAQAGETLGLQISGQSAVPVGSTVYYQVLKPDGTSLLSRSTTNSDTLNLTTLPVSGLYTLFVDPAYGATIGVQLKLTGGSDSGTVIDGSPGELSTTQPGQPAYLTFQAAAGEKLGLGISDLALTSGSYLTVYVYRPNGSHLTSTTCYMSYQGCALGINAVESGTYSVVTIAQNASQTAQFKTTLSRDLQATLARNQPLDLVIARRGQRARLSFTGEAGEALALQVAGQSTFPVDRSVYYSVYKPDGNHMVNLVASKYGAQELRLPTSGTYQVLVETTYGETMNSRVTLTSGIALPVDGEPGVVGTTFGGQATRATFQATAGQRLGLAVHDLQVSSDSYATVSLYRPDGAYVAGSTCYASYQGCKVSMVAAQTGAYSVVVTPQTASQTFSYQISVSQEVTGALLLDQTVDLALPRRGQGGRLSFSGQAGQWLSLQVAGQASVPAGRAVSYEVYKPDGTHLNSISVTSNGALRLPQLTASGTYTVVVDPTRGESLQVKLTLASGNSGLLLNGASASVSTQAGGQEAYLTFQATEGQRLGVGLTNVQTSNGNYFSAVLYRPDGNTASTTCYPQYGGCEMDIIANATGVYRLYLVPQAADQRLQATVTASTDVDATLTSGTLMQLNLGRPGQNGWIGFQGTSGQVVSLAMSDHTTQPVGGNVYYVVYKPDGSSLTSININASRVLQLPTLPATGMYRVKVNPNYAMPLNVGLTLQ